MSKKRVFITGATGCIGTYVLDLFKDDSNYDCFLLARTPENIKRQSPNFHPVKGNLEHIEAHKDLIKTMHYVIHIATDWSDGDYAFLLNVEKTHALFSYCDPAICKKIVYFSTASILGKHNAPAHEAGTLGTGYVRSKHKAYTTLQSLPISDRVVTLFPTLVFGGDNEHPYSHISSGIKPNVHYLKLLRFLYMDSAFHFLHSKDIAKITKYVMENDVEKQAYVLGNRVLNGKDVIETLCRIFGIRMYGRFKISPGFLMGLAKLFRITIGSWDKHCIEHPFFEYQTVSPSDFGMETSYPSLEKMVEEIRDT